MNPKSIAILTIGLFLGLGLVYLFLLRGNNASANWYHDSWGFRRKITIDNTKVSGSSDLSNFALLVSFSSDSTISANAKTDGSDILFTDSKGQQLTHEIEYYSAGTLSAWVRIPTLSTSVDTVIYMYYGNSSASGLENETAVWSSDYRGVWHLSETSGQHLDSTSNNNDSTSVSVTTQGSATGKVGGASDFASGNEVVVADSNSLDITGSFTAQAWVKADTIGGSGTWNSIIYKGGNSNYFLELTNSDEIDAGFYGGGDWRGVTTTNSPVSTGSFYHVAVVHDATADTIKAYVNGVEKGSVSSITQTPLVNTSTFTIGENFYNESFDGIIDEVRLSDSPKSVDWLLTEYNNQNSPSTFYSASHQEVRTRGPAAYWKLDEGYGSSVNDSSGNSITGTMGTGSSAPTWVNEEYCRSGKCLEYDGIDDYLTFDDSLDIGDGQDFTFTAWIKSNSFSTVQTVFAKKLGNSAGQVGYLINIGTGGTLNFYAADGTDQIWKGSGSPMSANTWYHIAFVFDEDNASNIAFYINGTATSGSLTGTLGDINSLANVQSLSLGIEPDRQYVFNGFIDEAKMYSYARTADEIKQDYLFASAKGASAVLGTKDATFMSDGLVGYWKLDESASGECSEFIDGITYIDDACDSSGNQQSGVWAGDVTGTAGKYGKGGSFDGTGDYISVTESTNLDISTEITVSAWVKSSTTNPSSLATVLAKGDNTYRIHAETVTKDAWMFDITTSNGLCRADGADGSITTNWQHLVGIYNGSYCYLYIDGTLVKQSAVSGTITTNNYDLFIGNNSQYTSRYFNGVIDEVRIYNRAFSSSEAKSLSQWAPGPVAYYALDEGTGTAVNDSTGTNNTGSLGTGSSAPSWNTGKYGKALSFDGVNDYVSVPDSSTLNISEGTISLWTKVNSSSTDNQPLFTKDQSLDNNGDFGISVRQSDDGTYPNKYYFYTNTGAGNLYVYSDQAAQFGSWEHIAVTFGSDGMAMYVNGARQSMTNASTGGMTNTTPDLYFMRLVGSTTNYTSGLIDEIKIYNYVQAQDQIIRDINAGHPAVGTPVGSTILHTKFNEGYGTTVHDSSSLLNDGTLGTGSSAPSWSNDGKFGKALSFDGNDYVDFGDNDELKLTFPFTISAWVNINELPSDEYTIISKWYSFTNDREYAFQIINDNRLRFGFSSTGSNSEFVYADTAFSSADFDQWIHVVLTADEDKNYTFYRNGVPDGSGTFSLTSIANDTASAMVGAVHYSNSLPSRFFKGKMDEVKLYPFDLNSEQVKTEYNGGKTMVLGAKSTGVGGTTPSNSAGREYCVPGDTSTCNAPAAEWKLEEGTGGYTFDTSENENQGTLGTGDSAPSWKSGKFGKGLYFDGGDYVSVSDDNTLDFGSGNFTVSAWVKSTATNVSILMKRDDGSECTYCGWFMRINSSGYLQGLVRQQGGAAQANFSGSTLINDGKWHYVALVKDASNSHKLYVDGQLSGTNTTSVGTIDNNYPLNFGWSWETGELTGFVDDVRLYDYPRTPAQIAWEYNRGAPVAQYKFDECQGSTAYNSALNGDGKAAGNNGTITIGGSGTASVGNCSTSSTAWGNGETGKINSSLDFDGTDDYVSVTDVPQLSFGDGSTDKPFSIAAWIKMDDATDFQYISKMPASGVLSNLEWALGVGATDRLGIRLYDNSALVYIGKYSNATLTAYEGQWIHVTVTYDGSESGNGITMYINGKEIPGTAESTGTYVGMEDTSSHLLIAGLLPSDATYKKFANGQIDDVRIFNYELTAEQIKTAMSNGAISFK